jgi:hypothetical protein
MKHPRPWLRFLDRSLCPNFYHGSALLLHLDTGIADVWCDDMVIDTTRRMEEARAIVERYVQFSEVTKEGTNE